MALSSREIIESSSRRKSGRQAAWSTPSRCPWLDIHTNSASWSLPASRYFCSVAASAYWIAARIFGLGTNRKLRFTARMVA